MPPEHVFVLEQQGRGKRDAHPATSYSVVVCSTQHRNGVLLRIDFHFNAIGNGGSDVYLKPGQHGHIAQCSALNQDRVDRVENKGD